MKTMDEFESNWRRQLREAAEKFHAAQAENQRRRQAGEPEKEDELIRDADPVRGY